MIAELICLATCVFYEARGESVDGQLAVAEVVLNRVRSNRYPDDICSVVNQSKQFSYTHDGKSDDFLKEPEQEAVVRAILVASEVIRGEGLKITSDHYHTTDVTPYWAQEQYMLYDGKLGDHMFYTMVEDY